MSALELTGPHVDVRYFTGAILCFDPIIVTDPVAAVYVDGRLDRIEWEHDLPDGGLERHVVPIAHVARLYNRPGVTA